MLPSVGIEPGFLILYWHQRLYYVKTEHSSSKMSPQ